MNSETVKKPFPVAPSSTEYKRGFEAILNRLNDNQIATLRAHYEAPGHRATVHNLAQKCGIASWRIVNRQYGEIAKLVLTAMGYEKPKSETVSLWLSGLVVGFDSMEMILRPEVVRALEESGIVKSLRRALPEAVTPFVTVEHSGVQSDERPNESNGMTDKTALSSQGLEPIIPLDTRTSETHRIRVDFLSSYEYPFLNRLGMTFAPGKKQTDALSGIWDRDLRTDLERLSNAYRVRTLISLLEDEEFEALQIRDFAVECARTMVELVRFPIRDVSVPVSMKDFVRMVAEAVDSLKNGDTVVTHCKGGLGRAGLTAACIAIAATDAEVSASEAIELVREARPRVIETETQGQFVGEFESKWRRRMTKGDGHYVEEAPTFPTAPGEESNIPDNRTSENDGISVDFMRNAEFPFLNRLGVTYSTGVELLDESDLDLLQLGRSAGDGEVIVLRFHAPAGASVPESMSNVISIASKFEKKLRRGASVIVHCKDNPGMAPLTVACIAIAATDAEVSASQAIELVREARPAAIESEEQEQFVAAFEKEWREVIENRGDHYFLYWQERSVLDHAANELPLDVVASNGLFGVEEGDTLWIITLTQEREFLLAGRLVVGEIVEYEEAMRRMPDAGLWQAEYYAFPEPGTEELLRPVPILDIAEELRFDGKNDRLHIVNGQINPQQLRRRRKLTPESVELVTRVWEESAPITDPEELVAAWQQVVEDGPDDPQAHYNLGVALDEVGRSEEAFLEYQATIRLDPNYFPALYNVGNYFASSQQFDEAIEMFHRAILVDGDYAPVHFMLGVAYFESGRFDDAIASTRQGLEIDPDDEGAYYNIAYWTFRHGDYRGAIARCEDVIARYPYFTSPHVMKGQCFRELGELENEIQSYRDALNIKVDDEGAFIINFTAVFFLGAAWERKITGSAEGIDYIEADNHLLLQEPTHQFCFAMGNLAQGDRDSADQCIEGLRTSAPDLARRLEAALNYADAGLSEIHRLPVEFTGEAQRNQSPPPEGSTDGDEKAPK